MALSLSNHLPTEKAFMPLDPQIRTTVQKKIEEYEGRVPHLYLDSVGRVTAGVGHLVANRAAVGSIALYKVTNGVPLSEASLGEKQVEYDKVAKQPKGYKASHYKQFTTLVMKDSDINALRDKHIDSFYKELTAIYTKAKGYTANFDDLPRGVQLALFDMIFNLGATKIVSTFVNFDKAVKAGDWVKAAEQSHRPQIGTARNAYVKQLFLEAVPKPAPTGLPPPSLKPGPLRLKPT